MRSEFTGQRSNIEDLTGGTIESGRFDVTREGLTIAIEEMLVETG